MNIKKISKIIYIFFSIFISSLVLAYPADHAPDASELRGKRHPSRGITGPVHTFVKTDKNANFKWGVRHHVGHQYARRK